MMNNKTTWKSSKISSKRKIGLETQLYHGFEREKFSRFQNINFEVPPVPSPSPSSSPRPNAMRTMSSSPTRTFLNSRLSKVPENFNYEVISIKDEGDSDSEDEMEYEETEILYLQDRPSVLGLGIQLNSSDNTLGLVKRKHSFKIETESLELEDRGLLPRFTFKTNFRYCDRAIYLKNSGIPRHFCDILGPGMCADCMKARKKQANINDSVESFPDISVSPYQLCVPPENDPRKPKTPSKVYKDCDVLFRKRSMSRSSPNGRTTGSPARPNSSISENTDLRQSFASSPALSSVSEYSRGLGTPNSLSVSTPDPNPRRTSIARYIDKNLSGEQGVKNRKGTKSAASKTRAKPKLERNHSDLHQNVFHKAISARMRTGGRSSRTPTIERRGKLNEGSYWRFLIPEPPVMEVGRMNVSIYTPKDLPGIKIFDESLFDI